MSSGVGMAADVIGECEGPIDTLLVAGGRGKLVAAEDEQLLDQVRRLAACSRRVTSVCTGAFVLAAAGLLDDRRATTHWRWCPQLAAMYPRLRVDANAIYVRDGEVWTSAGITAGIDLALALVADDHGQQLAAAVARELVVYLRRAGGQTQFSVPLAAQVAEREPLRELLDWIGQEEDPIAGNAHEQIAVLFHEALKDRPLHVGQERLLVLVSLDEHDGAGRLRRKAAGRRGVHQVHPGIGLARLHLSRELLESGDGFLMFARNRVPVDDGRVHEVSPVTTFD